MGNQGIVNGEVEQKFKKEAQLIYILYLVSFFLGGITAIIGFIIALLRKKEASVSWIRTHFEFQVTVFKRVLVLGIIGAVTSIIVIGWFILLADLIWFLYATVKGFLFLRDEKPIDSKSWF